MSIPALEVCPGPGFGGSILCGVPVYSDVMGESSHVFNVLVDARMPDDGRVGEVARWWFDRVPRVVVPGLWGRVQESLPLRRPAEWDDPHGPPHGVWADAVAIPRAGTTNPAKYGVYSPETLEVVLDCVPTRPVTTHLEIKELDEWGVPYEDDEFFFVACNAVEDMPECVQFMIWSWLSVEEADPSRPGVSQRWARVVRELADMVDVSYGQIGVDPVFHGEAPLDGLLRRRGMIKSVRVAREVLRGYSWVTICPPELAERLGGVSAMVDTGAFATVEELTHGGLWLQATPDAADYDQAAVWRVFKALAPVLPTGMPRADPAAPDDRPHIAWDDAANWQ